MTWDIVASGPENADKTVLLLPGGMLGARSYAEVMAEPALSELRLIAVTLPGNAGAPPPNDFSFEACAREASEFASQHGIDVVVGFSNGASIAYEMVVSGGFKGPVVLLGVSLSSKDEPAFFRGLVKLGSVLGPLPFAFLKKVAASLIRHSPITEERRNELAEDFARNNPSDVRQALRAYLRWLARDDDPARRLCEAGVPAWVMHAEKGDGGLTAHEREVFEACPQVHIVTLPGKVFFLPNEAPRIVAEVILEAVSAA